MCQVLQGTPSAIGNRLLAKPIVDSALSPQQTRDFGRNVGAKHIPPWNGEHSRVRSAIPRIPRTAIAAVSAFGAFGPRLAGVAVAIVSGRATGAPRATLAALPPLAAVAGRAARLHDTRQERLFRRRDDREAAAAATVSARAAGPTGTPRTAPASGAACDSGRSGGSVSSFRPTPAVSAPARNGQPECRLNRRGLGDDVQGRSTGDLDP